MKRSIILLLPLLVALASCSTSAEFSQQRFQDGIYYSSPAVVAVSLKSEDDFRREAELKIREKQLQKALDSIRVEYRDVYPGTFEYEMYFSLYPLVALYGPYSFAFNNWYWNRWHLAWSGWGPIGIWDPFYISTRWDWYAFGYGPFDPWLRPYPYGPWYDRYYRPYYYMGGGRLSSSYVYTQRANTQSVSDRHHTGPNTVSSYRSAGGNYSRTGSSRSADYTPRRVAGTSGSASSRSSASGQTRQYVPSGSVARSSSSSATSSSSRRGSSYTSNSSSRSNYSSSQSRSSASFSGSSSRGGSYSGGGSSRGGGSSAGSGGRR